MPLRVRLNHPPALTPLCRDLRIVADEQHHDNELRFNGSALYVKLRSARWSSSREASRNEHRLRALALVREGLGAELTQLGASVLRDRLLAQFLPSGSAGRTAPVRVGAVLALARVLDRARQLTPRMSGIEAVEQAAGLVDADAERSEVQLLTPTRLRLAPALPKSRTPSESKPSVPVLPKPVVSVQDSKKVALSLQERARTFLARAEQVAASHAKLPASPRSRRSLPDDFLAQAASFTTADLLTPRELLHQRSFLDLARPLIEQVAPRWRTLPVSEVSAFVQQLMNLHRTTYGYDELEVRFLNELRDTAVLSADGLHLALPIGNPDTVDNFDVFVHQLIYGLSLRYQRHLAASAAGAEASDAADARDLALARIMRAHQLVPMDRQQLAEQFGMRVSAARQAWQSGASHRHATALADPASSLAYAALPEGEPRLPRMAYLGRHR